jgi:hypothetical protein
VVFSFGKKNKTTFVFISEKIVIASFMSIMIMMSGNLLLNLSQFMFSVHVMGYDILLFNSTIKSEEEILIPTKTLQTMKLIFWMVSGVAP